VNLFRHKKTGRIYILLMTANMEADGTHVCIYQRLDHQTKDDITWVRPATEFFDGRFEQLGREMVEITFALRDEAIRKVSEAAAQEP
jgi:hypothetical protein